MDPTPQPPSSTTRRGFLGLGPATAPREPERVPWATLGPHFFTTWGYPSGHFTPEHLEILGPTGSGKSYFEATVLTERARIRGSHIVVVATKPADDTISALGWPEVTRWPPNQWRKDTCQVVYWAKATSPDQRGVEQQRAAVNELLQKLWKPQSNIVLAFDEIAYIESDLGLRTIVTRFYREARSLGITIVASTQRPAYVSRYMHSESKWKVLFAPEDEDDAKRMAEIAGNRKYYTPVLLNLDRAKKEFLILHTTSRTAYISHIDGTTIHVPTRQSEQPSKRDSSV